MCEVTWIFIKQDVSIPLSKQHSSKVETKNLNTEKILMQTLLLLLIFSEQYHCYTLSECTLAANSYSSSI